MQASTTEPSSNGEEASEKEMLDRFFKFLDDGKAFYKKLTVGQSAFGGHGLIATEDIQVRMWLNLFFAYRRVDVIIA